MSGKSLGTLYYFSKFCHNRSPLEGYLVLQNKQQTFFEETWVASYLLVMKHKSSVYCLVNFYHSLKVCFFSPKFCTHAVSLDMVWCYSGLQIQPKMLQFIDPTFEIPV